MAYDARIILAGQTPDILGSMARGNQLAAQTNEMRRQNALAGLFQQQGPGILAGDQNALNALALYDPSMALGVQQNRLGMESTRHGMKMAEEGLAMRRQEFEMTRENARMRGMEFAAQMDARQRAEAAEQFDQAVAMLTQAQTPEAFAQVMQMPGAQETVEAFLGPGAASFENRDFIIAAGVGATEAFKMGQSDTFRPASPEEAGAYGAAAGQFGPDGRFYPVNPPSGFAVETGPDGQMRVTQGPGVAGSAGKPFTEGQSKDNVYVTRAEGALTLLDSVGADALASRTDRMLDLAPMGATRGLQSENFQVAQQAGDEFLQAILRKDTGAAITAQEQDLYGKTYLPQPGDSPAVLEAKRQSRVRAVEAIRAGMDIRQITATERALVNAAERTGQGGQQQAAPTQGAPTPPPAAIDMLRAEPSMEAMREFDEVFGEGAASRALRR